MSAWSVIFKSSSKVKSIFRATTITIVALNTR